MHAATIENVAHVSVQAQTSHHWQMEAHEPTSDHITAISNASGLQDSVEFQATAPGDHFKRSDEHRV